MVHNEYTRLYNNSVERRLLIVDDDRDFAESLVNLLDLSNYQVVAAYSAQGALATIKEFDAQAALVDLRLPDDSGTALIADLKRVNPDCVCVMTTAYADVDSAVTALEKGAFHYLQKPFRPAELLLLLDRVFETILLREQKRQAEEVLKARNQELEKINVRLQQLVESTRTLTAPSHMGQIGPTLLKEFARTMAARGGSLFLRKSDGLMLVHSLDPDHIPATIAFPLRKGSLFERAMTQEKPILIQDIEQEPEVSSSGWKGYQDGSLLIFPLSDETGEIVGVISLHNKNYPPFISQDLELGAIMASHTHETLRARRASEALRRSEAKYRMLVDQLLEGIVIAQNNPLRLVFANPAMENITGYSIAELTSFSQEAFAALIHPEDRTAFFERFRDQLEGKKGAQRFEVRLLNKDDMVFLMAVSSVFIEYEEEPATLSVFTDITEQKKVKALEDVTAKLETAKKTAETTNTAKSQFLADMSHEIRTPLNAILGYAQILKRDKSVSDSQKDGLDIIERSGNHLLNLINDILDLSKIEAQKMESHVSAIDFPRFLTQLSEMIRIRAQQKGIAFRYETTSALPQVVRVDQKHLSQVLLNLLGNAIKFTEHGGVTLKVLDCRPVLSVAEGLQTYPEHSRRVADLEDQKSETKSLKSNIPKIRFQVSDSGVGIPPDQLNEIFLLFTRAVVHTGKFEGTGLGLAISQKLVRQMGGELQVSSTVGKGSTFWFELELPETGDVIANEAQQSRPISGYIPLNHPLSEEIKEGVPSKRKLRILVVDDKSENRNVLKAILLPLGFHIMEASDGRDAINKARECQPDLILMDLKMPEMNGFEATKHIRRSAIPHPQSHIRPVIIAVSASAFQHTRQESLAAGCNDFLTKPIQIETLLECLQRRLQLEWIYAEAPSEAESPQIPDAAPLVLPPQEELTALLELAEIRNISDLWAQIKKLKELDAKYRPFVVKIEQFLKKYQFTQLIDFIED